MCDPNVTNERFVAQLVQNIVLVSYMPLANRASKSQPRNSSGAPPAATTTCRCLYLALSVGSRIRRNQSIWRGSLLPEIQLPRRIAVRSAAARCQTPPPRQATMAQQQVDISAMSLEQLNTYKGQFENEIKQLPVWKSTSASGARR